MKRIDYNEEDARRSGSRGSFSQTGSNPADLEERSSTSSMRVRNRYYLRYYALLDWEIKNVSRKENLNVHNRSTG
jgi:hypothetical protein